MAAKLAFSAAHLDMCFQITTNQIPVQGHKMLQRR